MSSSRRGCTGGGTYCCVYGCKKNSNTNPELSFFRTPNDPERRRKWLQLVSREDLMNTPMSRVCEIHFEETDIMKSNRKILKNNAVPRLNLPAECKSDKETQTYALLLTRSSQTTRTVYYHASSQTIESPSDPSSTFKSDHVTQSATSLSANCLRKRTLESDLGHFQKRFRVLETNQAEKETQQDMLHVLCYRFLSTGLAQLVKAKKYSKSSQKGNRYPLEYKMFCLNLFYVSPQAYRLLQKTICLPSKTILCKPSAPISTQVSDDLMAALKVKAQNMTESEKHSALVVRAMSLKPNLFYDINRDKIIGFHEVDGIQSPAPAQYALVVLVRGIFDKWSQPIGFSLISEYKNNDNITKWIDKIISKLFAIGLKVKAFVSDLGPDLYNAAKKRGISPDKTFFTLNDQKIYYIFDAPQLIKLVRNNLMNYDFYFQNGAVAKFEHIKQFYEYDCNKTFKQAYKLTESHINPSHFEKMKVRYAAQLLSRSVASGLATCIEFKVIDQSAIHTVEFIKMMNDLFDVLNSSTIRHNCKHKRAFQGEKNQTDFLNKILSLFRSLTLINPENGNNGTENVKFIYAFQITIQSIINLLKDLQKSGFNYLLTRRLNQDTIENLFSKIRSINGRTTDPTCRQFISAFQKTYSVNICKPPKGGNCAKDLNDFLLHMEDMEVSFDNCGDVSILPKDEQENSLLEVVRSDYMQFYIPEKNAVYYVSGAVFQKCMERHNDCELLNSYLSLNQNYAASAEDINYDDDKNSLLGPPEDFVNNIKVLEKIFCNAFKTTYINYKIGSSIYANMTGADLTLPCPCFPKQYMLKMYIRMRIYLTLRNNNVAFRTSINWRKYFSVYKL